MIPSDFMKLSTEERRYVQESESRRVGLSWLAVSLVDGKPICELPCLQAGTLEYHLMEGTTQELSLPYDRLPVNWEAATLVGGVAYILLQGETPIWGGILMSAKDALSGDAMQLKVDTIETYLERPGTGDLVYKSRPQTWIVCDIIQRAAIRGMRNCIAADYEPSAIRRDREYKDTDDKSVLSAIQELANVQDGPEWGHWWTVRDDGSFRCVITARDRYGSRNPSADFSLPAMAGWEREHDATGTALANKVRAVSTADGDVRPSSGWVSYQDPSRPVWPLSYTPSTSIKDVSTLESHARRRLSSRKTGAVSRSVDLDLLTAPRLGEDWMPGDMVSWDITGTGARMPGDTTGRARVIGYRISFQGSWTLTPILQEGDKDYE